MSMKHLEVVAAVILIDNKILCVRRGRDKYDYTSYKYEFPGGKVEKGETHEAALRREIWEELKMDIRVEQEVLTVNHAYPDFTISLHTYLCTCDSKDLTLTEHIESNWMERDLIATLDWAEADIAVVDKIVYEGEE
jgi:8-oxo-dGTP diphosphatase